MSLTRLAMRLAASRAVRNKTLAADRVFDSAVDPIDQTIAETRQPLIVVTTDEHALDITGRDLGSGDHACDLVFEVAIASRVEVPAPDGQGGQITIAIPHTDEGMELTLDIMEHQIIAALTQDDGAWSATWMKLVPRVTRRLSRRGASAENGVRFAARQMVLTCDLVDTPVTGEALGSNTAWGNVLMQMEADPDLATIASLIRTEIEGALLADWRRAAAELGIPLEVADQIGIGPVLDFGDDPKPLEQVTIDGDGDGDGFDLTITAGDS